MSSRETSAAPTKDLIHQKARQVFGKAAKVHSWMTTPNPIFEGMRPEDFINYGSEQDLSLVMDELERIEQGIF